MAKWKKYTGSDEQIEEMRNAKDGFIVKYSDGQLSLLWGAEHVKDKNSRKLFFTHVTNYLICQPHPYVDEIKIWANTGCEVFIKSKYGLVLIVPTGSNYDLVKICNGYSIYKSCAPDWNIPGAEYQLTPFED